MPADLGRVDRHGRVNSPHVERFERRLLFLQRAKPKERHYADRDGEWGIADIANDAMLAILEYEYELVMTRHNTPDNPQPASSSAWRAIDHG
jgi:hypothetical protein